MVQFFYWNFRLMSHLVSKGQDGSSLDSTVDLLALTSCAIQLFNDRQNIKSISDHRLVELQEFLSFLKHWKAEAGNDSSKKFFTSKLWFDLQSIILGFESIVAIKLKKFPQSVIKPAIINQDCIENHFCQVRACNGPNKNPTFHLQESAQNSIRYGQTTISRKSNAGAAGVRKRKNWLSLLQCMVEPPLSGHPDMQGASCSESVTVKFQK